MKLHNAKEEIRQEAINCIMKVDRGHLYTKIRCKPANLGYIVNKRARGYTLLWPRFLERWDEGVLSPDYSIFPMRLRPCRIQYFKTWNARNLDSLAAYEVFFSNFALYLYISNKYYHSYMFRQFYDKINWNNNEYQQNHRTWRSKE